MDMGQIHFYLKVTKIDKKGQLPVIAQIALDYSKYRKQLGKVKVSDWNIKKQRLKLPSVNDKDYSDYLKFNQFLDRIESKARDLFNKALDDKRKITADEINEMFFVPDESAIKKTEPFFKVFDEFITANKPDKAERTIKGYVTVKNFLFRFQESTRYYLTWDKLNVLFIDKLKKYTFLTEKKQTGYYAKILRVLSTFLHWAEERNYYKGDIYDKLKAIEPEKEVIFLSLDELFTLLNYDFRNDRLNRVRDLYCFASFTGLRYSDIISLRQEHIQGKILTKTQKKTGQINSIPLNDYALEILKHYHSNEKPLQGMAIQNLNDYIKECCEIIAKTQSSSGGFNRLVIKKTVIGSETTEESLPLYKAITFHTARKTFITNSIMLGVNIKALQDMGAPKKEKDLKKYLKITDAFKTEIMDDTWNKIASRN